MRSWKRWAMLGLLGLPLLSAGCGKDEQWGEEIESAPVDVDALRQKSQEKKRGQPAQPGPRQP